MVGPRVRGDLHLHVDKERTDVDLPMPMSYQHQAEHVSACILAGKTPVISGERGMANIAVIEAAIRAARTKTTVEVARV